MAGVKGDDSPGVIMPSGLRDICSGPDRTSFNGNDDGFDSGVFVNVAPRSS